jgi:magnesium-transporting ATPase (P-type)
VSRNFGEGFNQESLNPINPHLTKSQTNKTLSHRKKNTNFLSEMANSFFVLILTIQLLFITLFGFVVAGETSFDDDNAVNKRIFDGRLLVMVVVLVPLSIFLINTLIQALSQLFKPRHPAFDIASMVFMSIIGITSYIFIVFIFIDLLGRCQV